MKADYAVKEPANKILVSLPTLQDMLECGKQTADKIGIDAGAKIKVGARSMYNVKKITEYLESIAPVSK